MLASPCEYVCWTNDVRLSVLPQAFPSYLLFHIAATDGGNPKLSSTTKVKITVTNTNDNVPSFVPGSPTVSVSEAVAIGTKLVQFNATDKDGGQLSFSIKSGNTNNALILDSVTGLLKTKTKLDRETVARYNLVVTVTDKGGKSSSANLTVNVLDVNDNTPVFNPSSYAKDVTENTPAGKLFLFTLKL